MLGIFQVTLIILCATNPQSQAWKPLLAASVLSLASSIAMCTLSYMEHSRSLRPSLLLNGYLFVTVLLDTATLRTLWLLSSFPSNIRGLLTAAFVTKAIVLVLEARGKWIYSSLESRRKSPEQFSGLYQQAFLSWLNRLVWQGANHLLKPDDLYPVNDDIASGQLSARYTQEYDRREY
jgi:ATP-binding cassette subfamily C (CFTR/MRP) protein 1